MVKLKKGAIAAAIHELAASRQPRLDLNGWVLCPGDAVLIVSPGEEYHGLFAKVDAFPTTLELSCYVQIDGRPSASGRVLLPNAQLRWMGPDLEQIDLHRPNRPNQRVRVVLDNEADASAELKEMEGQLGTVAELNGDAMFTVKFESPELAAWPAAIHRRDLLVVPIPVMHYVPEPEIALAPVATEQPAEFRSIPLDEIIVTRNTRTVFDETALAELAESIKVHGVIQPIVLRPYTKTPFTGKHYELVAGERRYRAAELAGLNQVPAMVRTLTDREFLEVQLLENLQRVDVRPADEASAFSQLLANGFSAEEIGQRVGKAAKFVLQRARLTSLIPFWQDLLEQERLPLVAAHELARLPPHSQVVVKKHFESYRAWELKQTGLLEASTVRHAISQDVMRLLSSAVFPKQDATLCPSAGACTACPKNSANNRGLFDEVAADEKAAKCLDAACFSQKKDAFVARRKNEVAGTEVVLVSSSYDNPPKGAVGYKFYSRAKESDKGAVPALLVDGSEAGFTIWVKLSKDITSAEDVAKNTKAEREATIHTNRVKKMQNELLAEKLRDSFTAELRRNEGPGIAALLSHWLRRSFTFGRTRTTNDTLSYLVAHYGWQEPTEAELNNTWSDDNPHTQYLNRQLNKMLVLEKVALFFDLKIRDGLDQTEYTSNQANLVQALPASYQKSFDVTKEAEKRVAERYGKKQKGLAI